MSAVLLAAGIWILGGVLGASRAQRGVLLGLLWLAVVSLHLTLPDGHPLRGATGGSAAPWLLLAGFGGVALLYGRGVAWLKARAPQEAQPEAAPSDRELSRYARHMMLREIGGPGQMRLRAAKVLVIGAGGLGSPVLLYLAAAGIGTIGVVDDDDVDATNLQRQVIHRDDAIGTPKVFSAADAIRALNPHVTVKPYHRRLGAEDAEALIAEYDLVIDGCDNFETRALVNTACVATGTPLISGAISQWEGQVSLFDPSRGGPCYACVFPKGPAPDLAPSCAQAGVLGPLPGIIGTIMAAEAVKHLVGAGETLSGRMLIYDALYAESREMRVARDPGCPVCG
ncbi:MAG: molybdopterin biosynthesis protein [Rhodobacterales bacterium]|nr:MAG: molybdopterin biosynthesis protein [Rhodobacterales bacterium]